MADYPDYTKIVRQLVDVNILGTKAETVTHLEATETDTDGAALKITPAESGKKIGLLKIIIATESADETFWVQIRRGGVYEYLIEPTRIGADAPVILDYPAYVPDQDETNGTDYNLEISCTADCFERASITLVYFLEDA